MASDRFLATGDSIGRYRVERLLGVGGMGQVYHAVHTLLGKPVAIKILNRELANRSEFVARFFNEARAAASLNHANIIDVHDVDRLPDGRAYMVLEYLDGESLSELLAREGALSAERALSILKPVCSAVGAAHRKGIVHRDLKPANIFLVEREGIGRLVKVLDFGVAKLQDAGGDSELTRSGVVVGTPSYMAPEQARGEQSKVGPQSDVYAAGLLAFAMLVGRRPFAGSSSEVIAAQAASTPPPLGEVRPDVPAMVERVLARALSPEPADRWATMDELACAFELALAPDRAAELESLLADGASPAAIPALGGLPVANAGRGSFDTQPTDRLAPASRATPSDVPTTLSRAAGSGRRASERRPGLLTAAAVAGGMLVLTVAALLILRPRAKEPSFHARIVAPAATPVIASPAAEPRPPLRPSPASRPVVVAAPARAATKPPVRPSHPHVRRFDPDAFAPPP